MDRERIETVLRDFIDRSVMRGQGGDVTASTPLFEFGILDSFALLSVIAFIASEFQVALPLESLRDEDFKNISGIAALVEARMPVRSLER